MSKTPQAIRGTQDIFGADAEAFAFVVETFERVRKLYRFRRAEMPVFEKTEVFSRAIGETTDVVSKEMYSFDDRGGESLTLRPEFTAGIARAFLSNGWQQHAPVKLATHGPLFRYERPQKGRYRQFHQIDAEIIGAGEPQADVELLTMADHLLKELGIEGVTLHLNHHGLVHRVGYDGSHQLSPACVGLLFGHVSPAKQEGLSRQCRESCIRPRFPTRGLPRCGTQRRGALDDLVGHHGGRRRCVRDYQDFQGVRTTRWNG